MLYLLQRCIEMITQILEQVRAIEFNFSLQQGVYAIYLYNNATCPDHGQR